MLKLSERLKKTTRPAQSPVQHQIRSLLTGESNDRVNNLCGRWLRLLGSRSLSVHVNKKRDVARKNGRSRRVAAHDRGRTRQYLLYLLD